MSSLLSPDDPNQKLAEQIGKRLAEGESVGDIEALDDEGWTALVAYRRSLWERSVTTPPSGSETLWMRIEENLSEPEPAADRAPSSDRAARRRRSAEDRHVSDRVRILWRAAAAAMVVVLLALAVWLLVPGPDATLVAEAQSEIATYQAEEGATIRLRPRSTLYQVASDGTVRYRLEGEAAFSVSPQPDRSFEVVAKNAVVRVTGTQFVVRAWTEEPVVYLQEGSVELASADRGPTTVLRPGQWGRVEATGRISVDSSAAQEYTDWLKGRITLEARPAGEVIDELEYHYGLSIQCPDSIRAQTLSGALVLKSSPEETLRDLGVALGGQFTSPETGRYRFRSSPSSGPNSR